jgi:hypothetical protein
MEILDLKAHPERYVRVSAFARYWKVDPATLYRDIEKARSSPNASVRRAAFASQPTKRAATDRRTRRRPVDGRRMTDVRDVTPRGDRPLAARRHGWRARHSDHTQRRGLSRIEG